VPLTGAALTGGALKGVPLTGAALTGGALNGAALTGGAVGAGAVAGVPAFGGALTGAPGLDGALLTGVPLVGVAGPPLTGAACLPLGPSVSSRSRASICRTWMVGLSQPGAGVAGGVGCAPASPGARGAGCSVRVGCSLRAC
jgi:hypothetical protein